MTYSHVNEAAFNTYRAQESLTSVVVNSAAPVTETGDAERDELLSTIVSPAASAFELEVHAIALTNGECLAKD